MIADPRYRARNREEREDWVIRSLRADGPMTSTEIRDTFGVAYPALEGLARRALVRRSGVVVHLGAGRGGSRRVVLWGAS